MNVDIQYNTKEILESFKKLHAYLVKNDFAGHEYDDLLASEWVSFLTFGMLYPKIAAVQIAKRSPINLRKILGVKKLKSTKAFGFMIKGYLYYYKATGDDQYFKFVKEHLQWLTENGSKGYPGMSWGNDFDFASRVGFFPKGLPTIVWTSHITTAFDMAYKELGDETYKDVILQTATFTEKGLERIEDETGICFAYSPGLVWPIHNSNLLGAVNLLRGWQYSQNEEWYKLAKKSVDWSCSRINADGSWYYGDTNIQRWIDNYHTGYNLDCLSLAYEIGGSDMVDEEIIHRTYRYWRDNLFLKDGTPKFYYNKLYPIDIQAAAQAIESFAKYSRYDPDALNWAWKVAEKTIELMAKSNGSFRYRISKYWKNNLEAIHWGQGTMLSALGCLLFYTNQNS